MKYFKREENITEELISLYESRGYTRYKPGCFEEYSLYQENKSFLIGKNVITFSGLGGKLLAMRPDVTLSLIRHTEPPKGTADKYYYNEKVYRQTAVGNEFKEISQTGVEITGLIDKACEVELASLICDTLSIVSDQYILDISHMGFTEGLIAAFGKCGDVIYDCLRRKDVHDFAVIADREGFDEKLCGAFCAAVNINGNAAEALEKARSIVLNDEMQKAVDELSAVCDSLSKAGYLEKLNVNFSVANNADYYNGIIFNGYIDGVPQRVLSGGRYDKLLKKLGKYGGAIGFALYLGEIDRYFKKDRQTVDYLVLYDDNTQDKAIERAFELKKRGNSVRLARKKPEDIDCKQIINCADGEVKND